MIVATVSLFFGALAAWIAIDFRPWTAIGRLSLVLVWLKSSKAGSLKDLADSVGEQLRISENQEQTGEQIVDPQQIQRIEEPQQIQQIEGSQQEPGPPAPHCLSRQGLENFKVSAFQ